MSDLTIDTQSVKGMATSLSMDTLSLAQFGTTPSASDCGSAVASEAVDNFAIWFVALVARAQENVSNAALGADSAAAQASQVDDDVSTGTGHGGGSGM